MPALVGDAAASLGDAAMPAEAEDLTNLQFQNPVADDASARMADFDHDLTDDELSELAYTFQAVDSDGSGTIEPNELHAIVAVLAGPEADVSFEDIERLFQETKAEFQAWVKSQGEDAIMPTWMDNAQQNHGVHGQTSTGVDRHHAQLAVDKESALERNMILRRANRVRKHPLVRPFSSRLNKNQKAMGVSDALVNGDESGRPRQTLKALMLSPTRMIFAEYLHMMCSTELLAKHVKNTGWHKQASTMRKFRHAFGPSTSHVNSVRVSHACQ
eukprot:COSAG02_NODE_134_length_34593_cov_43.594886_19_plen_272_part_00